LGIATAVKVRALGRPGTAWSITVSAAMRRPTAAARVEAGPAVSRERLGAGDFGAAGLQPHPCRIEAEQLEAKPGDATQAVEAGFCFGTVRIEHAHAEIMAGIVARGEQ
jgi:hypothetical protein